jgi:hypothetical protein
VVIRPCAEFTSDLPEDIVEDDEGGFIEAGGRSVTEALAELLAGFGCSVDPPENAGDNGWELHFQWKGRKFWSQISLIESYLLQTADNSFFSKRFAKNKKTYADVLTQLSLAMDDDPRFQQVRWYLKEDVMGGGLGEKSPVSV